MHPQTASILVFGAIVVSGVAFVAVLVWGRQRLQELAVRERIALIERGLVPSPESDPAAFERLLTRQPTVSRAGARFQSAGIMFMGLGGAMAMLISLVAQIPAIGLGVGGALAILGLAAFVNGMLLSSSPAERPRS